jgi:hypothetical protein
VGIAIATKPWLAAMLAATVAGPCSGCNSESPSATAVAPPPVAARLSPITDSIVPADSLRGDSASVGPNTPPDEFDGLATRPPELPRVLLDTKYVAPTGRQVTVRAGDNLQDAIDRAKPGDVLLLQPGAVFTGPFTLPKKAGAGPNAWVVIRSAAPDAQLPAEGQRVTPGYAAALPKLVGGAGNATVLTTAPGASFYRLLGLEITTAPEVTTLNSLVRLGNPSESQSDGAEPTDLVLDRVYLHGTPTLNLVRCLILSSARTAVIDSYLADAHARGQDAQAIVGWNGSGPYKIVNNYLEGSGENVMFGGARPSTPDLIPSDIEFRRNHLKKPAGWQATGWLVKNLFELKFARRVLVEGNVLEGNWTKGQTGYAVNLKVGASMPWATTEDVTIRYNRIQNAGAGFSLLGADGQFAATVQKLRRVAITDNVLDSINVGQYRGDGRFLKALGGVTDVLVAHNTMLLGGGAAAGAILLDGAPAISGFTFRDNIVPRGRYGMKGARASEGAETLASFAPGATWAGNVLIGQTARGYPPGTYFAPDEASIGFVDAPKGDVRLGASSSFRRKGAAGSDPGANVDAVEKATAGVVIP